MGHNLADVGTRYEHYTQLLDLWEDGLAILESHKELFPGTFDKNSEEKMTELQASIKMLQKQVDILACIYPWSDRDKIEEAHTEIDKDKKT